MADPATNSSVPIGNGGGGSGEIITGGHGTYYLQNGGTDGTSVLCGRQVVITNTNNNKKVTVTIQDECPTCDNENSIDLSQGAFEMIANLSEGEVPKQNKRTDLLTLSQFWFKTLQCNFYDQPDHECYMVLLLIFERESHLCSTNTPLQLNDDDGGLKFNHNHRVDRPNDHGVEAVQPLSMLPPENQKTQIANHSAKYNDCTYNAITDKMYALYASTGGIAKYSMTKTLNNIW
ncbi:hypothetical protein BD410DRAFT_832919 [Rickenella mellea]|uniref:RlpA-like protein double-psi beta-barrel domain-containing protein n=1 Tax=Rickenella mellea TaxID=50990 RepID=A0A4Y7PHL0_9AGAM|nr:hypothetical protein BD410DRAFT_832919 [Rickenella mellea]